MEILFSSPSFQILLLEILRYCPHMISHIQIPEPKNSSSLFKLILALRRFKRLAFLFLTRRNCLLWVQKIYFEFIPAAEKFTEENKQKTKVMLLIVLQGIEGLLSYIHTKHFYLYRKIYDSVFSLTLICWLECSDYVTLLNIMLKRHVSFVFCSELKQFLKHPSCLT